MIAPDLSGVEIGQALPDIRFGPITRTMLALYAGASGDHNPVHIDTDFAAKAGLPDVFAHGMLPFGVLARVVTGWAGIGRLRELGLRFQAITRVHDVIVCSATVSEMFEVDGERRARLALTVVTEDGRRTLSGDAVIALD